MKIISTIAICLLFVGYTYCLIILGETIGKSEGRAERGEWVKTIDTFYHSEWNFKPK